MDVSVDAAGLRERRLRVAGRVAFIVAVVVMGSGVVGAIHRGMNDRPDWRTLSRESRYMWEHHASPRGTAMFGYLPTTSFALWPFMVWPPKTIGLSLYIASNVAAASASLWLVYRWWGLKDLFPGSFAWVVLLVAANVQHVLQANQLTLWTLFLCVAGLTLVGKDKSFRGGMLIGLAGLIKSMPLMLVGLLLLRRRWRALGGVALTVVLFDIVPSVSFFGIQGAVREHRLWLDRADWHSGMRQIEDPCLVGVYKHPSNFSYPSVLTRWLRGVPDADEVIVLAGSPPADVVQRYRAGLDANTHLTLAPMPRDDQPWAEVHRSMEKVPRFYVASLSVGAVKTIWIGSLLVGLAGLAWFTWRTGQRDRLFKWHEAAAVWMLAIFWVTPMMRHYYLVLALPAVAVVWRAMWAERVSRSFRFSWGVLLAALALTAWVVGVFCLGWDVGRWYGLHLGVAGLLLAACVWASGRGSTGRDKQSVSADPAMLCRRS